MWGCSVSLLPLLYLFPILSNTISEQNLEAAAAPMLFYWGLSWMGGRGLFIQVFFKGKQPRRPAQLDLGTVLGQRRPRNAGY